MPDAPTPRRSMMPTGSDPVAWLWGLLGLGLIAYGCHQFYLAKAITPFGSFLALAGVTMIPISVVSLLGGLGLLVWAAWWTIAIAKYPMDYMWTGIAVVFGLTAIIERSRAIRARR